jgi:PD-(D/E)XK nuclease superfamily protein
MDLWTRSRAAKRSRLRAAVVQSRRVRYASTSFEGADDVVAPQGVQTGHGPAEVVASFDNVLTTNQKGAIAEGAITSAAIRLGVGVFRAVADERYDLVLDVGARLLRVQCKTAALNGDVLVICCYSCRRTADGMLKRSYTSDEIGPMSSNSTLHCGATGP